MYDQLGLKENEFGSATYEDIRTEMSKNRSSIVVSKLQSAEDNQLVQPSMFKHKTAEA